MSKSVSYFPLLGYRVVEIRIQRGGDGAVDKTHAFGVRDGFKSNVCLSMTLNP